MISCIMPQTRQQQQERNPELTQETGKTLQIFFTILYFFRPALQPLLEQQNLPCTMLKAGDRIEKLDYYAPLLSLGSILSYKDKADIPPPFAFKVKPLPIAKSNLKRIGIDDAPALSRRDLQRQGGFARGRRPRDQQRPLWR